ncbi:hypothetical protein NPIL_314591 [Nephila pilipes]|uniref:Uncharacterized protein n=1 Tax=Nephila pilipes TaxID=299642 RepID=A0A8X6U1D1_NEPPI|nr:hypothetical protein NPIL_314591 [Nephila pilipes]
MCQLPSLSLIGRRVIRLKVPSAVVWKDSQNIPGDVTPPLLFLTFHVQVIQFQRTVASEGRSRFGTYTMFDICWQIALEKFSSAPDSRCCFMKQTMNGKTGEFISGIVKGECQRPIWKVKDG